jgi:alpha-ketoglutarate-dependent taurine dioxygenase
MELTVQPTDATLGAYVTGVDLRTVDAATWQQIQRAWHAHAVLVFPGQHLTNDEQVAFGARFGRLESMSGRKSRRDRADILRLANLSDDDAVVSDEHDPGLQLVLGNMEWHSDSSFWPVSAKASVLSAHVVPDRGGETEFADMRAAYDDLPDERRRSLEPLVGTHSYAYSQGRHGGLDTVEATNLAGMVGEHPVVRIHPDTGRKSLFIGRHVRSLSGYADADAQPLIQELLDWACRPPRVWSHRWQVGDVVVWDNRCVLHRLRPWDLAQPRVMFHTRIAGDGPNPRALDN